MRKVVQRISTRRVVAAAGFILLLGILSFGIALAATNVTLGPTATPPYISPGGNSQNPYYYTTTVSHSLASQGYINVRMFSSSFDTSPLRSLVTSSLQSAGSNSTFWNGKADSGVTVADGLYYPRIDGISYRVTLTSGASVTPYQIAYDNGTNPATIYFVNNVALANQIYKSTDNGQTWSQIPTALAQGPGASPLTGVSLFRTGSTPPPLLSANNVYVFVVGVGYKYISRYDTNAGTWTRYGQLSFKGNAVDPYGISRADTNGSLYVTVSGGSVAGAVLKYYYDPSQNAWTYAGLPPSFVNPLGIDLDGTGTIFVADATTSSAVPGTIWKSTDAGNTFSPLITGGTSDGKVSTQAYGLYAENNRVWVADTRNNRVQQFWQNGDWILNLSGAGQYGLSAPRGIAVDTNGYVLVGDCGNTRMQKYLRDNILGSAIQVDNTSPVTYQIQSVSSPSDDFYYQRGGITITANAADDPSGTGVGRVEFYKDAGLGPISMSTDYSPPYVYTWNTTPIDDGSYQLMIKVFDNVENYMSSAFYPIIVDNTSPNTSITTPAQNAYVKGNGSVAIYGSTTDAYHKSYSLSYDDSGWQLIQDGSSPISNGLLGTWNTSGKSGPYTIKLSNLDYAGNSAEITRSYTVDNALPTASADPASPDPFSPSSSFGVKDTTTVNLNANDNYGLDDASCTWRFEVKTTSGTHIWETTGYGLPPSDVTWNGKDDGDTYVPDATYNYYFTVTDRAGNSATAPTGQVKVDNNSPTATVGSPSQSPFSPNADGIKDTTSFTLTASDPSDIDTWTLEIKNTFLEVVRSTSGTGNLTNYQYVWDGKNNPPTSSIVPYGTYTYTLTATDNAGNTSTSTSKDVIVDTQPPYVDEGNATVNPFGGTAKPSTVVTLSYSDANGFDSSCNWSLVLTGATHTKTFSGTGTPPSSREWLGDKDGGGIAADGTYTYSFSVSDKAGNVANTAPKTVILDKTNPVPTQEDATVNPFSPDSSPGVKDDTTISLGATDLNGFDGSCSWSLVFKNNAQVTVRTYSGSGAPPANQVWDGKYDDNINYVPDGQYSYVLSVTDRAGNTASTAIKYVTVDNNSPTATVGSPSQSPFSPNADGIKDTTSFTLTASDPSDIDTWTLEIKNAFLEVVRSASGSGNLTNYLYIWDGRDNPPTSSIVPYGTYTYALTATDKAGNSDTSISKDVIVDTQPPGVDEGYATVNPFGGSLKQVTVVTLSYNEANGIDNNCAWQLKFIGASDTKSFSGTGAPPFSQEWNGWNDSSQPAANGTYTYAFSLTDKAGNTATTSGKTVVLDRALPTLGLGKATVNPFSPNGDGIKDATTVTTSFSDSSGAEFWSLIFKTQSGITVRQYTGSYTPTTSVTWDGRDDGGAPVSSGNYNYYWSVTDNAGNVNTLSNETLLVVDNNPPTATVGSASQSPFSPNADGIKDTSAFTLNASDPSDIDTWTLEIKNAFLEVIRSASGSGNLTNYLYIWDGRDNPPTSSIVPYGTYTYTLTATDKAGNSDTSISKDVIVDTQPPDVGEGNATVNPFGGSLKQVTVVTLSYNETNGIDNNCAWQLKFTGASDTKTFSGTGAPPFSQEWNGYNDSSNPAANGTYTYAFSLTDKAGNTATTSGKTVVLDRALPTLGLGKATVNPFSPNGDGIKDTTTVTTSFNDSSGADSWSLIFKTQSGITVRQYTGSYTPTTSVTWDGKDDGGATVSSGNYNYYWSVTDNAGNVNTLSNETLLVVDNNSPTATVGSASQSPFSPNADGIKDTSAFSLNGNDPQGGSIASWNLAINNGPGGSGSVIRSTGGSSLPGNYVWDGKDNSSVIVDEGTYSYALGITDTAGNVTTSSYQDIIVDKTSPTATVGAASPNPFSPNNDGYKDSTSVDLTAGDANNFDDSCTWKLVFHDTSATKTYSGTGEPPFTRTWDGSKDGGGTAPSGTYSYDLQVIDKAGNSVTSASQNVILDITPLNIWASPASPGAFSNLALQTTTIMVSVSDAYGFDNSCPWNMVFKNHAGATVRTITGSNAPTSAIVWDGKYDQFDSVSYDVPEDNYTYVFTMKDIAGNSASTAQQGVIVDNSPPIVSAAEPVPARFSPNNDGDQDTTTLAFSTSDTSNIASWQVRIYTSSFNFPVRTTSGTGSLDNWPFVWDGKNDFGTTVADGPYKYVIRSTNGANLTATSTPERTVLVDTVVPTATITNPTDGQILGGTVDVRGTADDANFTNYKVEYRNIATSSWTLLINNSNFVINDRLFSWDTKNGANAVSDGDFILKLTSSDGASNNVATVGFSIDNTPPDVTIGAPTPQHISPSLSPGVQDSTSSILSVTDAYSIADWYLDVRPVGTTSYVKRATGSGNPSGSIAWNGKDQGGNDVAEGNYRFVIGVNDLAGNPASAQSADVVVDHTAPSASLGAASPASISPNGDAIKDTTDIPINASDGNGMKSWKLEIFKDVVVHRTFTGSNAPPLSKTWDGKNDLEAVVPEDSYNYRLTVTDNAGISTQINGPASILVDFTNPVIGAPSASPDHFSPTTSSGLKDTTTISASVTDNSAFDWIVKIYNPGGEISRQFTGTGTTIDIFWDGKNESGNFVSDGTYTYKVDATDIAGNPAVQKQGTVVVDDTYPDSSVGDASNGFFSPNGDGEKDTTEMPLIATDAYGFVSWQLDIEDGNSFVVRSTGGSGAPPSSFTWDGKNNGGSVVSSGTYSYSLTVTDPADNTTTSDPKYVIVDSAGPTSVSPSASRDFFSPRGTRADDSIANGNGYEDSTIFGSATDDLSTFHWTMTISRSGTVYRTFTGNSSGTAVSISQLWDGKDESGKVVDDGVYTYKIQCTDDAGNIGNQISGNITVDTTFANIDIGDPAQDDVVRGTVDIKGEATDTNFDFYQMWIGQGTSPISWSTRPLTTTLSYAPVSSGYSLSSWDTTVHLTDPNLASPDDCYVVKLKVTDKADNSIEINRLVTTNNQVILSNLYPIPGVTDGNGNLYVSGTVNVVGSATNTGLSKFASYTLEACNSALTWTPIATVSTQVINSTLGIWSTSATDKYTLRLQVKDTNGNIILRSVKDVYVDNTKPTIGSIYPIDRVSLIHTVNTLSANISDNYGLNTSSFQLRLNDRVVSASYESGKIIYAPPGGISDGSYTAELTVKDLVGNSNYKKWSFSIDSTAPTVQITRPQIGEVVSGKVVVAGTVTDNSTLKYYCFETKSSDSQNDNWAPTIFTNPVINGNLATWISPPATVSTAYDLRVTATDMAGNVTQSPIVTVWVVPTAQSVGTPEITSVGGFAVSELSTKFFTGTLLINGIAPQGYSITSRQVYPVTGTYQTVSTLSSPVKNGTLASWNTANKNGKYEIELHETSTSPAFQRVTVAVDCKVPTLYSSITPGDAAITNNPTISITARASDPEPYYWVAGADTSSDIVTDSVTLKVDGIRVSAGYDSVTKKVSYQPTEPLSNDKHLVDLTVADRAGNSTSKRWSFTVENGDSLVANITHLAPSSSIGGAYCITGTAYGRKFSEYALDYYFKDDPLNRRIPTWVSISKGKTEVKSTDGTLAKWTTSGKNGWVNLRLRTFDKAGNVKTFGPITVQLDNKGPTVGSAKTDFSPADGTYVNSQSYDGTLKIFGVYDQIDYYYRSGSGVDDSRIDMIINGVHVLPTLDSENGTITYVPSGMFACLGGGFADGTYIVKLSVYDKVGNVTTKNWTFTVDNTPPTATIVRPASSLTIKGGLKTAVIGVADDTNISIYSAYSKLSVDDDDLYVSFYSSSPGAKATQSGVNTGLLCNWSVPKTEGYYDLKLSVTDLAGNTSIATSKNIGVSLTGQDVPTAAADLADSPNGTLRGTIPIKGTVCTTSFGNYTLTVTQTSGGSNGALLSGSTQIVKGDLAKWKSPATTGTFKVELKVYNKATGADITSQLPGTKIVYLNVDNIKPTVLSMFPANKSHYNPSAGGKWMSVAFSEGTMDSSAFSLTMDGQSVPLDFTPSGNAHFNPSTALLTVNPDPLYLMRDGQHTFVLNGKDIAGNSLAAKSWYFTVDRNQELPGALGANPITASASLDVPSGSYVGGTLTVIGRVFDQNISKYLVEVYRWNGSVWENFKVGINALVNGTKNIMDSSIVKWATTGLNGLYKLVLTLTDKAGNSLVDEKAVVVDNNTPTAVITSPASTSVLNGVCILTGTATDDANFNKYVVEYGAGASPASWTLITESFTAVSGGTLASWDTTQLPEDDGIYTIKLSVSDKANKQKIVKVTPRMVENSSPVIQVTAPTPDGWVSGKVSVIGTVSDKNLMTRKLVVDKVPSSGNPFILVGSNSITDGSLGTWDSTKLATGDTCSFTLSATDQYGHTGNTISFTSRVDNTKPLMSSETPSPGYEGSSPAEVSAVLDDALSGVDVASIAAKLDGISVTPNEISQNGSQVTVKYYPSTLSSGSHSVNFRFKDLAGNYVSRSWLFKVQ